jgi:hypothetical protein
MAKDNVKVVLEQANGRSSGFWVNLSISNLSKKNICLNGAVIGLDGPIGQQVFYPRRNGIELPYQGVSVSRPPDYVAPGLTLGPQQTLTVSIELSKDFDVEKGKEYEIAYQALSIGYCKGHGEALNLVSVPITLENS